jgi:hypothetical protein
MWSSLARKSGAARKNFEGNLLIAVSCVESGTERFIECSVKEVV